MYRRKKVAEKLFQSKILFLCPFLCTTAFYAYLSLFHHKTKYLFVRLVEFPVKGPLTHHRELHNDEHCRVVMFVSCHQFLYYLISNNHNIVVLCVYIMVYRIVICVGFCFCKEKVKGKKNIFLTLLLKQCLKKIPRDVDKADFFVLFLYLKHLILF